MMPLASRGAWRKCRDCCDLKNGCARFLTCVPALLARLGGIAARVALRMVGVRLHQGKRRTWNNAFIVPEGRFGGEAWQPDGFTISGTPIGAAVYLHQDGRTHCQGTGSVGSSPNSSRLAVRMFMPPTQSCLLSTHDSEIWTRPNPSSKEFPTTRRWNRGNCPRCQCAWADWGLRSVCSNNVLGILGRRTEDDWRAHPRRSRRCGAPIGVTRARQRMRWRTQAGGQFAGQGSGDQVGRRCAKARNHQTTGHVTHTSGHTVGRIGHLLSSTLVPGRCSCCPAVQPLAKPPLTFWPQFWDGTVARSNVSEQIASSKLTEINHQHGDGPVPASRRGVQAMGLGPSRRWTVTSVTCVRKPREDQQQLEPCSK